MQPLKAGVHFLVKRAPVPIVPVGIAGAFEAYPRTSKLPKLSPLFMPPTNHAVAAVVGKPLEPERMLKLSREEFLQTVFDAIQKVQLEAERLRRNLKRPFLPGDDRRGRRIQQAALQHFAGPVEFRLPVDLRRAVRQAVAELFQRVAGHVRALVAGAGDARHRMDSGAAGTCFCSCHIMFASVATRKSVGCREAGDVA